MNDPSRHDRTVRLLTACLETIAQTAERVHADERELEPALARAATATRNAVQLELLTREEAVTIWREVAERHPGVQYALHAA